MQLTVSRNKCDGDTTLGSLLIDDIFECFTLEDEYRTVKVWGETRIPAGTYEIKFRREGKFHERYAQRFPQFHNGMLEVTNVPGFQYILIHTGNTDDDTAGCLLVGEKIHDWKLVDSTKAYIRLYKQVAAALLSQEPVMITYIDNDRGDSNEGDS